MIKNSKAITAIRSKTLGHVQVLAVRFSGSSLQAFWRANFSMHLNFLNVTVVRYMQFIRLLSPWMSVLRKTYPRANKSSLTLVVFHRFRPLLITPNARSISLIINIR